MNYGIRFLSELDEGQLKDKIVFYRPDWNLPVDLKGVPTSLFRIQQTLTTIKYLLDHSVRRIIIGCHLDPWLENPASLRDPRLSTKVIANLLIDLLRQHGYGDHTIDINSGWDYSGDSKCMFTMLENLRFSPGEVSNDRNFSQALVKAADIAVNDAIGAAHRAHASTDGVNKLGVLAVAGLLFEKELKILSDMLSNPVRPFFVMMGGRKMITKLDVIKQLLLKVDKLLLGGAIANTFLLAKGVNVGRSLVEPNFIEDAAQLFEEHSEKIILPQDTVGSSGAIHKYPIRGNVVGMDIGPDTMGLFQHHLDSAQTFFWNGPMGVCEKSKFSRGTQGLMANMFECWFEKCRIIGGGDLVAALEKFNYLIPTIKSGGIVLTAGGAGLKMIEQFGTGVDLPTIAALKENAAKFEQFWS